MGSGTSEVSPAKPWSRVGKRADLFVRELLSGKRIDGRSHVARLYRDTLEAYAQDYGGSDQMSEAEWQLARRAAALAAWSIIKESEFIGTGELDIEKYISAVNAEKRVLTTLGLRRRAKDATPDLDDILDAGATEA